MAVFSMTTYVSCDVMLHSFMTNNVSFMTNLVSHDGCIYYYFHALFSKNKPSEEGLNIYQLPA